MQPYDGDKVLCQYRDITARSNVKLQLERTNYELKEIQKAAQIGQWKYSSREKTFYYRGYNGIVCTEEERSINFRDYYETIPSEDLPAVNTWMEANRRELLKEYIEYRILLEGQVYYMRQQCYLRNEEEDGNIVLEGYIQNITDIQRKRNDINTLTHAINNAKESVYAARRDGTLIFANRQFEAEPPDRGTGGLVTDTGIRCRGRHDLHRGLGRTLPQHTGRPDPQLPSLPTPEAR